MSDWYLSRAAHFALPQWAASTTYATGSIVRQLRTTGAVFAAWSGFGGGTADTVTANFGGTTFNTAAPSGFSAWGAADTWDPSNKGAAIVLSGGNLIASRPNASAWQSVRSVGSHSSGKWYLEIEPTVFSGAGDQIFGIVNSSAAMSNYVGSDNVNGMSHQSNGTGTNNLTSYVQDFHTSLANAFVGIALDLDLGLYWIRASNSLSNAWNGNPWANPATGVGGFPILTTILVPSPAYGSERCFRVTAGGGGSSGGSQPAWNLGNNATTTDGALTWTECTGQSGHQQDNGVTNTWTAPAARWDDLNGNGKNVVVAGDRVFISSDHVDVKPNAGVIPSIGTPGSPNRYFSVTRTTGNVPPLPADITEGGKFVWVAGSGGTVAIGTTGSFGGGPVASYWTGVDFELGAPSNGAIALNGGTNSYVYLDTCILSHLGGISQSLQLNGAANYWNKTSLRLNPATPGIYPNGRLVWRNSLAITTDSSVPGYLIGDGPNQTTPFELRGVDLSMCGSMKLFPADGGVQNQFVTGGRLVNCRLSASFADGVSDTSAHMQLLGANANGGAQYLDLALIEMVNCDSANTEYSNKWVRAQGVITTDTSTILASGGASDGSTSYSLKLDTTKSNNLGKLTPLWIDLYVQNTTTGSSVTATVEAISSASLNTDEFWGDLEYLGDTGDNLSLFATSGLATQLTTAGAQTSSTVTWNNAPATPVKQKLTITFTPQKVGLVRVRVSLGKSSTVWVDPHITLS